MIMGKFFEKKTSARVSALRIFVSAVVLVLFLSIIFAPDVAHAVCPDGYIAAVKDKNLDWQCNANNLDLDKVKSIVNGWFSSENYDFSQLEKKPVVVAVVDTGVALEHEIFTGKYDQNGVKTDDIIGKYDVFYRDEAGRIIAKNTASTDKDATDDASNRHGTHVAGILATLIHELNLEKYIKIMPIKASTGAKANFTSASVAKAIKFALDNGADVVNMSIADEGVATGGTTEFDMVSDNDAKKAVFVAAAGNNGRSTADKFLSPGKCYFPAANKNVIGVMNYTENDGKKALANNSNYGSAYDICAPGTAIWSANGYTQDEYKTLSGTSMATPIISFASALAMLKDRAFCAANGLETKTYTEIADYVKNAYDQTVSKDKFTFGVFSFNELLSDDIRVKITADKSGGDFTQYINSVKQVKLRLEVLPYVYDGCGTVEWRVDGVARAAQSDPFIFEFLPENKEYSVNISATWQYQKGSENLSKSASCTIKVCWVEYTESETKQIKIDFAQDNEKLTAEDGKIHVEKGGIVEFSIKDEVFKDMKPSTAVMWYVNDKYVANDDYVATEKIIAYRFSNVGEYVVKAKIGDYFTAETTIIVENAQNTQSKTLDYVTIALACALGVVLVVTILTILVRKSRAHMGDEN